MSGRSPPRPAGGYDRWRSWIGDQLVAGAARGLQIQRIGGVALELAAQAVDLNVDGALLRVSGRPRQRLARYADPRRRPKQSKDFALALCQTHDVFAAAQFAALGEKHERTEPHAGLVDARRRRRAGAPQNRTDPQQQLLRLVRFDQIVV